jgi:hypothetical protein
VTQLDWIPAWTAVSGETLSGGKKTMKINEKNSALSEPTKDSK